MTTPPSGETNPPPTETPPPDPQKPPVIIQPTQQTNPGETFTNLTNAVLAIPEKVVNGLREAIKAETPPTPTQQGAAVQQPVQPANQPAATTEPPALTRRQKFHKMWFGGNQ